MKPLKEEYCDGCGKPYISLVRKTMRYYKKQLLCDTCYSHTSGNQLV